MSDACICVNRWIGCRIMMDADGSAARLPCIGTQHLRAGLGSAAAESQAALRARGCRAHTGRPASQPVGFQRPQSAGHRAASRQAGIAEAPATPHSTRRSAAHRLARCQQHRRLAKRGAHAERVHRRLDVLHRVVDGERLGLVPEFARPFLRSLTRRRRRCSARLTLRARASRAGKARQPQQPQLPAPHRDAGAIDV